MIMFLVGFRFHVLSIAILAHEMFLFSAKHLRSSYRLSQIRVRHLVWAVHAANRHNEEINNTHYHAKLYHECVDQVTD